MWIGRDIEMSAWYEVMFIILCDNLQFFKLGMEQWQPDNKLTMWT
jgi:hypothetical protein